MASRFRGRFAVQVRCGDTQLGDNIKWDAVEEVSGAAVPIVEISVGWDVPEAVVEELRADGAD
ncbi:hypothetical protein GCM10010331_69780 [Streptomyces xanthochromogenes]|nr:hypothetical protein GCM10010331_69780 [Streptomyces xanthochromogenes]